MCNSSFVATCRRTFKSVQGLLGHNRMKHNSSTVEYRDSSIGCTESGADEYSGPSSGGAEVSTPEHGQAWEDPFFDFLDSSAGFSIADLEQQGAALARMSRGWRSSQP